MPVGCCYSTVMLLTFLRGNDFAIPLPDSLSGLFNRPEAPSKTFANIEKNLLAVNGVNQTRQAKYSDFSDYETRQLSSLRNTVKWP